MRYSREDGCRAWLTYGMLRADLLRELLEEYDSAECIYDNFMESNGAFLSKKIGEYNRCQLLEHGRRDEMHKMLVTMQNLDMRIVSEKDNQYPDSLRNIQSPPALLFYRGNPDCLMGKCIAVVGSRRASPQGTEVTHKICKELSEAGVTIISGFALGIDTAAHEGCLDGGSPTAAILGCGIDVDYPSENCALKEKVIDQGGILMSEYPPGVRANRHVFQVRNRIISGLGKALLMMESRIQSGSMLTVHHALDQGKEVYAYPGIPGTEWAEGAHQLLREGANYFTSSQDILEDLGWDSGERTFPCKNTDSLPALNEEQRKVFALLNQGEKSFDQLADESGLSVSDLSVALTMLQMMGIVKAMPGKCYCRV